jgi:hypothetical protein
MVNSFRVNDYIIKDGLIVLGEHLITTNRVKKKDRYGNDIIYLQGRLFPSVISLEREYIGCRVNILLEVKQYGKQNNKEDGKESNSKDSRATNTETTDKGRSTAASARTYRRDTGTTTNTRREEEFNNSLGRERPTNTINRSIRRGKLSYTNQPIGLLRY